MFWADDPYSTPEIWAQRVSAAGEVLWASDGVPVCTVAGAYVVWRDRRDVAGTSWDLYAQRLNSLGATQWIPTGAPVAVVDDNQTGIDIVSDGIQGVSVSWTDSRTGLPDIYAQHLDIRGVPSGPANGLAIYTNAEYQGASTLVSLMVLPVLYERFGEKESGVAGMGEAKAEA